MTRREERLRKALQDIASGNIPREQMAREPGEALERWQDRNAYTLLAWMQETARKALADASPNKAKSA